ncbi:LOW QUALITY PROTEIN: uncharacterized protein [Panulirus ornatus]|uniref:LOW QUALITY PROTEIN: uncharacterized protein n=1 Tax=Panulirus ornatus TaxID=150431 RepID=UPI003A8C1E52
MTSVHKESSHTTKTFSSTSGNNSSRGRKSDQDFWDFDLPIRRKGRFFQDSSFEHERDEFDAAVRNVLKRWGEGDLLGDTWEDDSLRSSNILNRYRKMRADNLKEDNQAVTITDDDTCHKIMLDVHDFMNGDVKVKLVGERELVVEGQMGNSNNTDATSLASQRFKRRFSLPDLTNMDAITSVMSSDGILTITAPKIVNRSRDGDSTVPINVTGNMKSNVTENYSSTSHSNASSDTSRVAEAQGECDCEVCSQRYGAQTTTNKQQRTHKVPIKINATLTENHQTSQTREPSHTCDSVDRNTEAKQGSNVTAESTIKKEVKSTYSNTTMDDSHKMNQGSDHRENVSTSTNVGSDTQHSTGMQGSTHTKAHSQKSTSTKREFGDIPFSIRDSLPIKRKGHFFDDSFFDDTRTDFHKAVNDILREWGETDLLGDTWDDTNLRHSNNLNRYRKLRAHNLKEDNQAVTVTDDNTCHKIVLDVHDFMNGDVKVKLVGERELVVEGQMGNSNNTDVTSLASQRFERRFSLPDLTNMDAITSVMSSDGILTITAPKIVNQAKDEDFTIPIKVSGTVKNQAKGQFQTSSTCQATTDNSTRTKDSTMVHKQETENQKNESGQNVTYSSEQKGEKSTLVKIDVADANSETLSHTDGSQKSSEHFTSRATQEGSTSSAQANTVNNRANEEIEKQSEQKQNVSDISTQTSFTSSSKMNEEKHSESSKGITLPIKTRGLFFNDMFFEDTWKDYQDAVRDVVVKWGGQSTADDMTCYRKLRTRDMTEENQAVKASEDERNYKFVVDVQDFVKDGDVTVKAVDERELVVEGRVEREEGGSRSTKRFLRRFVVPNAAQMESVSSVMSSDGVLTIMAPKKPSSLQGEADDVAVSVNRSQERREKVSQITEEQSVKTGTEADAHPSVRGKTDASLGSSMSSVSTSSSALDESLRRDGSSCRHSSSVSSSDNIKTSSDVMGYERGHVQEEVQTGGFGEQKTDSWNLDSENTQHKKNISCKIKIDYEEDDVSRESTGSKTSTFADENESDAVHRRLASDQQSSKRGGEAATSDAWATDAGDVSEHYEFDEKYKNRSLPIKTRGLFSDDTFFRDCRLNFKTAIKEVLQKAQETPSSDDEVAAYRSLRRRDLKLENQAVHVDDDLSYQTIVLDVYDFLGGEVTVRVVEGKELVVEGRAKRKEGTSLTTLSFVRRFPLPDRADLETISAVMASDGVLVIVVPKLRRYSRPGATRGRELSNERQARLDGGEMGRGWKDRNVRESSRESQGRSCRSFMSSRLRDSPDMFSESQRRGRETGPSWQERNVRDSSTDSEGSCHAFGSSRRSRHQHFSSDLF